MKRVLGSVLVVEDNEDTLDEMLELLRSEGFVADGVQSAFSACVAMREKVYDVALIDHRLGQGDTGLDLILHANNHLMHDRRAPAWVIITGMSKLPDHEAKKLDLTIVEKPCSSSTLVNLVKNKSAIKSRSN